MYISYDKDEIREQLTLENIYELLNEWGGEPSYESFGILATTICHNPPGEGSRKLYYYSNTSLCRCYTGCEEPLFDIFQLFIKVKQIQENKEYDLNYAVRWVAQRFNITGNLIEEEDNSLEDWKILSNYERIQEIQVRSNNILLKEYDMNILKRFNYNVKIEPWLAEGISQEILDKAFIGYYPGDEQITIPHFDINNRLIGIRGRTLGQEEAAAYGKYRPLKVNKILYTHPLGMNLYNLNNSKENISRLGKAIVLEGEKSVLKYRTYFGENSDISVACCGSNITNYQIQLLLEIGVKEIIVAFDRQFQKIGDEEFNKLKNNILKLNERYRHFTNISFIFDKKKITDYKDSPLDKGKNIFLKLFNERIIFD